MIEVRGFSGHASTRSKPLFPGKFTSSRTRSGANALAAPAAALPSATHCTSNPSKARLSLSTLVNTGSSSTTSTRFFMTATVLTRWWWQASALASHRHGRCGSRDRQRDEYRGPLANCAADLERSAVIGDDPTDG